MVVRRRNITVNLPAVARTLGALLLHRRRHERRLCRYPGRRRRCRRRRACSTAISSSPCRPRRSTPTRRPSSTRRPKADPPPSSQLYEQQKNNPGFSLKTFVAQYFTPPVELRSSRRRRTSRCASTSTGSGRPHAHDASTRAAQQLADPAAASPTSCRAGAFARSTTGTRTSRCSACRKRAATDLVDDMLDNFALPDRYASATSRTATAPTT